MTPSTESWVSEQLRKGANTLLVPRELTTEVVTRASNMTKAKRNRSALQIVAVVAVMAVIVVGVSLLRSNTIQAPTPAATPTPLNTNQPVAVNAAALLGTWQLVRMRGYDYSVHDGRQVQVTFNQDGTWTGSDQCNDLQRRVRVAGEWAF